MNYILISEKDSFYPFPVSGYVSVRCPIDHRICRVPYNLAIPEPAWICDNGSGSPQCKSCVASVIESLLAKGKPSAVQQFPFP